MEKNYEELYRKMVRATNEVFYHILYKDISHDELVAVFEKEFEVKADDFDRTVVTVGAKDMEDMTRLGEIAVNKNIELREQIRLIKNKK